MALNITAAVRDALRTAACSAQEAFVRRQVCQVGEGGIPILVITKMTLVELGKGLTFLHTCALRVVHARGL